MASMNRRRSDSTSTPDTRKALSASRGPNEEQDEPIPNKTGQSKTEKSKTEKSETITLSHSLPAADDLRSEILPRRKTMIAIIVAVVIVLAMSAVAFLMTADRVSRNHLEPELNRLLLNAMEKELVISPPDLMAVRQLMEDFIKHPRIASIQLHDNTDQLLIQIPAIQGPNIDTERLQIHRHAFTTIGHDYEIVIANARALPLYFLTETISTLLIIGSISSLLMFLLYVLIRRWQQYPYHDLKRQLDRIQLLEQDASFQFRAEDPDLQPLVESLNEFYWHLHRRNFDLARAHQQAESARQRATLLAQESARMNDDLEKEIRVRSTMERQLGHTKSLLDAILNAIPFALFSVDQHGNLLQYNRRGKELLKTALLKSERPVSEAGHPGVQLGQPLNGFIPELDDIIRTVLGTIARRAHIQQVHAQHDDMSDGSYNGADGSSENSSDHPTDRKPLTQQHLTLNSIEQELKTEVTAYALDNSDEAVAVIRLEDIRQRLKMEEMMVQSEKMLTVGGLAAGMAHEINNPLGAILQNLQNIRRRLLGQLPANKRTAESLGLDLLALEQYLQQRDVIQMMDHIKDAGERAAAIIESMLNFSRQNDAMLESQSVSDLIDNAINIARSDLNFRHVELQHSPMDHLPAVNAIPGEIEQVLVNLIKNALQALSQYHTDDEPDWKPVIRLHAWRNGDLVSISVEDNGSGVPADKVAHVFEPFFTTKEVGEGTGLGLSVSYFIVTNHHKGQMLYRHAEPHGARFIVKLPISK